MYPSPDVKLEMDQLISEDWLPTAEREHQSHITELNLADAFMDNDQVPAGFSEGHSQQLSQANDPTSANQIRNYVVINQVYQTHEHILGNFIKAKQTVEVYARGMRDNRKVVPIRHALKYTEQRNQSFDTVVFPCIDNMLSKGLDWALIWYDPFEDRPNGRVVETRISSRNVLFDVNSVDPFMRDTKWRCYMIRMKLSDAKEEFKFIEGFDVESLTISDEVGDNMPAEREKDWDQWVTIHVFQHVRKEWVFKKRNGNAFEQISEEEYVALKKQPGSEGLLDRSREKVYYVTYWNRGAGSFFHRKMPTNCFTLIPCINRRSERRIHPVGDFVYHKNLQDLFNVLWTIVVNDSKEGRKWLVGVDPATYTTKAKEIEKAIEQGGRVIPVMGNSQILQPPGVSEGVILLLNMVKQAIADIRSLPEVSEGKLPSKQIAQGTVQALMMSAQISHGRKDLMIRQFLTELAKVRYEFISKLWTEEDWLRVSDAGPGDPEYVPINLELDEASYHELLFQMAGLQAPPDGAIPPEVAQAFLDFKTKFERENSVRVEVRAMKHYDNQDFDYEDFVAHIQSSGLTPAEFVDKYDVQTVERKFVLVNKIDEDMAVDLQVTVDFEAEHRKDQDRALTLNFADRGWVRGDEAMQELGVDDAIGKYQRAQAENGTISLAKRLQQDKNFQAAVSLAEELAQSPKLKNAINALLERGEEEVIIKAATIKEVPESNPKGDNEDDKS